MSFAHRSSARSYACSVSESQPARLNNSRARGMCEIVADQRARSHEVVDDRELGLYRVRHRDPNGAIQLDDRRRLKLRKERVKGGYPRPVGTRRRCPQCVQRSDRGLNLVRSGSGQASGAVREIDPSGTS